MNRLNANQSYRLAGWMESNHSQLKEKKVATIAAWAQEALGFEVCASNVRTAMEATGLEWQPPKRADRVKALERDLETLTGLVNDLMDRVDRLERPQAVRAVK